MIRFAALAALLLSAGCSVFGGKAAPEPSYSVTVSEPPFEIRDYPPLTIALTRVEGRRDDAVGIGFGRLFDYISGANAPAREIAMTAPVLTAPEGEEGAEIAMTAPVLTEAGQDGVWQVMFVLPEDMTEASAPRPTDPEVEIATIPARRVATVTFSGILDAEDIAENRTRLAEWLSGRPERVAGPWQAAGYNPPWTLPWLRRNEVLVPVAPPG